MLVFSTIAYNKGLLPVGCFSRLFTTYNRVLLHSLESKDLHIVTRDLAGYKNVIPGFIPINTRVSLAH